jgi:hypothetical protein
MLKALVFVGTGIAFGVGTVAILYGLIVRRYDLAEKVGKGLLLWLGVCFALLLILRKPGGGGLGLAMTTGMGLFAGTLTAADAWIASRRGLARRVALGMGAWLGVYAAALLIVSLSSREQTLGLNEAKAFCGFYLDCHLHASVVNVQKVKSLGALPDQRVAQGVYYVVTVRISSDARRATLKPHRLAATVVDSLGNVYERSSEGEKALDRTIPFEQPVGPGGFYTKDIVFDLPSNVQTPRLLITEGPWVGRLVERFLIGDEDSLFHKKTTFQLT